MEVMNLKFLKKLSFLSVKPKKYRKNESYWFLLPLLGLDEDYLRDNNLINTYLGDHSVEYQYENCIYLMFNSPTYSRVFNNLIDNFIDHPNFVTLYDIVSDTGSLMVVFSIPEELLDVYELFKEGKYSQYPEEVKDTFFPKYTNTGKMTNRFMIFVKHIEMRKRIEDKIGMKLHTEAEVWDKPELEREIYLFNKNYKTGWQSGIM